MMLQRCLELYPLGLPVWKCVDVLHDSVNAVIFLAENPQGMKVAIKRFKFSTAGLDTALVDDFLLMTRALGLLDTRGLVRLLDVGIAGEALYMVMEYLPGDTLRMRLSQKPLPPLSLRLQWFEGITRALGAVHGLGLLHLDLKTSNILLREDDTPALLDFGMETRLLVEAGVMREDEIYCTPYYVSPERIIGDTPDERADLYALGVILYELLVGHKPYESASLEGLLKKHALAPIPRLPDTYSAYQPLIDGLLAKFPEGRLQSAAEVVHLLHKIINDGQ
jgi:serine/threonine-protein kinase/serine/threonine-protein kinase PpkA